MGSSTVAQLAADPSLRLRVVAGERHVERFVRGAHISDLDHPARYVLPDEIVLTNGLWLDRIDVAAWVHEVRSAGAAGIGFGLSERFPAVPRSLATACDASGLPLLEVPEDLSFGAIADWTHEREGVEPGHARVQLMRLRRVVQDLARGGGHTAVLDLLRRETRLPVWLIGPGGRSLTRDEPVEPQAAREAARAARRGAVPCAVGPRLSAFGVGGNALATTVIVVGAPLAEVTDEARLMIEQVAAYVVLDDARRHEREGTRSALAEELVDLLRDGELSDVAFAARMRAIGLRPDQPMTVVASSNAAADVTYAAAGCDRPSVTARSRGLNLLLVQGDDDSLVDELAALVAEGGDDPVLGSGQARSGRDGMRQAVAEAVVAHQLASGRPVGERIVRQLGPGSHVLLLEFLDPHVLRAFRDSVLGAVRRWDAAHNAELVSTVAAFLANDGQWRRTAASLHVHANTLRYRLDRVAELSGRRPDTTSGRVDFALALAIRSMFGDD